MPNTFDSRQFFDMLVFRSKNTVERIFEKHTILHTVYSDILATIMHPKIHDAGISLAAPHFFGNGTTTFSMFDQKSRIPWSG